MPSTYSVPLEAIDPIYLVSCLAPFLLSRPIRHLLQELRPHHDVLDHVLMELVMPQVEQVLAEVVQAVGHLHDALDRVMISIDLVKANAVELGHSTILRILVLS